ncbi:MAG: DUF2061 domain-containing protein [Thermoleophilia bacterium]|nr:DUF2061 domain-containing protein [Thermoleophilia bacterium]
MESVRRSAVKALSWRTFASLNTGLITWLVTGRLGLAATIGVTDSLAKLVTYFLHERLWDRIAYGRPKEPEYQI